MDFELFANDEVAVLEFKENLPNGVEVLSLEFEGTILQKVMHILRFPFFIGANRLFYYDIHDLKMRYVE